MQMPFQTSIHLEVYDSKGELLRVIDKHNEETIWAKLHTPSDIYLDLITQPFSALLPASLDEINKTMFNYVQDLRSGELWLQFTNDSSNKQYSVAFNWTNNSPDETVYLYGLLSATSDKYLYTIFDLSSHPVEVPPNSVVVGRYIINYDNVTPTIPTESTKASTISANEILGGFMTKTTPDMRDYKYTRIFQKTSDYLGVDVNDTDINSVITVSFDSTDEFKRAWSETAIGQIVYKYLSSGNPGAAQAVRWVDYYKASQRARVVSGNVFYHIRSYLYPIVNSSNYCDRFFGYTDTLALGIREDNTDIYPWKMNFVPARCVPIEFGNTDWHWNGKGIYISKWTSMTPRYIYNDYQNYTLQDVMYLYWGDNPYFTVYAYVYDTSKVNWTLYVNGTAYQGKVITINDRNRRIEFDLSALSAGEGIIVLQATNAFWINMVHNGTDSIYVMSPRFVYAADNMYGYAVPFAGFLNVGSSQITENYISAGLATLNGEVIDLDKVLTTDDISNLDTVSNLPIDALSTKTDHQYWVWLKESEKDKLVGKIGVYNTAKLFTMWGRYHWDHTNTHVAPVYVTDNNIITFRPTNIDEVNEMTDYLGLEGLLEDTYALKFNEHIKVEPDNREITFKDDKPLHVLVNSSKSYIVQSQGSSGYDVRIPEGLIDYTEGTASISVNEYSDYQSITSKVDPFNDGSGIALYQFDGTADDTSGNYNGTWTGTEQYDTGKFGQAAKFDGSSYITAADKPTLTDFTLSWWSSTSSGSEQFIFYLGENAIEVEYYSTGIRVAWGDSWGWSSVLNVTDKTKFHFFVMTYDATSKTLTVYIDMQKVYSNSAHANAGANVSKIEFGAKNTGYNLTGLIDQFRIFNRVLSIDEIGKLCKEEFPNTTTTVATYNFETTLATQETMRWLTVNYSSDSVLSSGEYLSVSLADGNGAIPTDALETWTKYETYNIPDSDDSIVKDESSGTDVISNNLVYQPAEVMNQGEVVTLSNDTTLQEHQNFKFMVKVRASIFTAVTIVSVPMSFDYNGVTYFVEPSTVRVTDGVHLYMPDLVSASGLDIQYKHQQSNFYFSVRLDSILPSDPVNDNIDMVLTVLFRAKKKDELLPYDIHFKAGYQGPQAFKHSKFFLLSLKADTDNNTLYSEFDGVLPVNSEGLTAWTNSNVQIVDENTFQFTGVSSYIKTHTDIADKLYITKNNPFTLSFDVTIDEFPSDYAVLWAYYRSDNHQGYRLCIDNYGHLYFESSSNFTTSSDIYKDFTTVHLSRNQAHKIELQFEYNRIRVFIDGRQVVYTVGPHYSIGFSSSAVNFVVLGCDYDLSSHYFTGKIANLFMLNDVVWFHDHKVVTDLDEPETTIVYDEDEVIVDVHLPFAIDNKIDVIDESGNHVDFSLVDTLGYDVSSDSYGSDLYIKLPYKLNWSRSNIFYSAISKIQFGRRATSGYLVDDNYYNLSQIDQTDETTLSVYQATNKPTYCCSSDIDSPVSLIYKYIKDVNWSKPKGLFDRVKLVHYDIVHKFTIVTATESKATPVADLLPFYVDKNEVLDKATRLNNWDQRYFITDYIFFTPANSDKSIGYDVYDAISVFVSTYQSIITNFDTLNTVYYAGSYVRDSFSNVLDHYLLLDVSASDLIVATLQGWKRPQNAIWSFKFKETRNFLYSATFASVVTDIEQITSPTKIQVLLSPSVASIDKPILGWSDKELLKNKDSLDVKTYVVNMFESKFSHYVNKLGSHVLSRTDKLLKFWIQTTSKSTYATDEFNFMLVKDNEFLTLFKSKQIDLPATEVAWISDSYEKFAPKGTTISNTPTNTLVIYKHRIGQTSGYIEDPSVDRITAYQDLRYTTSKIVKSFNELDYDVYTQLAINYTLSVDDNVQYIRHFPIFSSIALSDLLQTMKFFKQLRYDEFEGYIDYPASYSTVLVHDEGELPYDAAATDVRIATLVNTEYNVLWDPNKISADKITNFGHFTITGSSTSSVVKVLPIIKVIDLQSNKEKVFAVNKPYYDVEDITDKLYSDLDNPNKRYWMDKWYVHDIATFTYFNTLLTEFNSNQYQFQYGWIIYASGVQAYDFVVIKGITIMPEFTDASLYQTVSAAWYVKDLDLLTTDTSMLPTPASYEVKIYNSHDEELSNVETRISLEDIPVENFNNGIVAYLNGSAIPTIYERDNQLLTSDFGQASKQYIWVRIPTISPKSVISIELHDEVCSYQPSDVFDSYFDFTTWDSDSWEKMLPGRDELLALKSEESDGSEFIDLIKQKGLHWYKFDGDFKDTLTSDVASNNGAVFVDGLFGQAIETSSMKYRVTVPFDYSTYKQVTYAFWTKYTKGSIVYLIGGDIYYYLNDSGWYLAFKSGYLSLHSSGFSFTRVYEAKFTPGEWVHIAAAVDHEIGRMFVYVNGVMSAVVDISQLKSVSHSLYLLGVRSDYIAGGAVGYMDDLMIYNGLLSESEIRLMLQRRETFTNRAVVVGLSYGSNRTTYASVVSEISSVDDALEFRSAHTIGLKSKFTLPTDKKLEVGFSADSETLFDMYIADNVSINKQKLSSYYVDNRMIINTTLVGDTNEFYIGIASVNNRDLFSTINIGNLIKQSTMSFDCFMFNWGLSNNITTLLKSLKGYYCSYDDKLQLNGVVSYSSTATRIPTSYPMYTVNKQVNKLVIKSLYGSRFKNTVISVDNIDAHYALYDYVPSTSGDYIHIPMTCFENEPINVIETNKSVSISDDQQLPIESDLLTGNSVGIVTERAGKVKYEITFDVDDITQNVVTIPAQIGYQSGEIYEQYRWYFYTTIMSNGYVGKSNYKSGTFSEYMLSNSVYLEFYHRLSYSTHKVLELYDVNSKIRFLISGQQFYYYVDSARYYTRNIPVSGYIKATSLYYILAKRKFSLTVMSYDSSSYSVYVDLYSRLYDSRFFLSFINQADLSFTLVKWKYYKLYSSMYSEVLSTSIESGKLYINVYQLVDPKTVSDKSRLFLILNYFLKNISVKEISYNPVSLLPIHPNQDVLMSVDLSDLYTSFRPLNEFNSWISEASASTSLGYPSPQSNIYFIAKTGYEKKVRLFFVRTRSNKDLHVIYSKNSYFVWKNVFSTNYFIDVEGQGNYESLTDLVETNKVNNISVQAVDSLLDIDKIIYPLTGKSVNSVNIVHLDNNQTEISRSLGEYTYTGYIEYTGKISFKYTIDDIGFVEFNNTKIISAGRASTYYGEFSFVGYTTFTVYGKDTCCGGHMYLYFKLPGMADYELFSYDNLKKQGFEIR